MNFVFPTRLEAAKSQLQVGERNEIERSTGILTQAISPMRFLVLLFAFAFPVAFSLPVRAQNAAPIAMQSGEIALEGEVVSRTSTQFVLRVFAFQNPNGNRAQLPNPKNKIVFWPRAKTLVVGQKIRAIGRDGGSGRPLQARECAPLSNSQTTDTTAPVAPIAVEAPVSPYPASFRVGDLNAKVVWAGFDYPEEIGQFPAFERVPMFGFVVELSGENAPISDEGHKKAADNFQVRRWLGPQNQFIEVPHFSQKPGTVKGYPARFAFHHPDINPNWEWVETDLDLAAPQTTKPASLKIENLALPAIGAEATLQNRFVGPLGTKFSLEKIARKDKKITLFVRHERPEAPADLEIPSFGYSVRGDANISGGGGLSNRGSKAGINEISINIPAQVTNIAELQIQMHESSRQSEKRDPNSRVRLRFPLQKLREIHTISPAKITPRTFGSARKDGVQITLESTGVDWGKTARGLVVWTQTPESDAKRGIIWQLESGSAKFNGDVPEVRLSRTTSSQRFQFHADGTPRAPRENVQHWGLSGLPVLPNGEAPFADLTLNLQGRAQISSDFEREIEIPLDGTLITPEDDGESALILRKVQRFFKPEDLPNYPKWIQNSWPNAGIALVFERNPLLPDAEFFVSCLDAEDDAGRELKRGILIEDSLYNIDFTDKLRDNGKFYTLIVGAPAPEAQNVRVWLQTREKGREAKKLTLEMKGIDLTFADANPGD